MDCPCIDCVCIPICRNKLYGYLFSDCMLLKRYIPNYNVVHLRNVKKMKTIIETLKPPHWEYKVDPHYNSKFPVVQTTLSDEEVMMQLRKGDRP